MYLNKYGYDKASIPTRNKLFFAGIVGPDMVSTNKKGVYMDTVPEAGNTSTWCPDYCNRTYENSCDSWLRWKSWQDQKERKRQYANKRPRAFINPQIRRDVAADAHYKCVYCGRAHGGLDGLGNKIRCVVDHFIPLALGGTNERENLVFACRECNREKETQIWEKGCKINKKI